MACEVNSEGTGVAWRKVQEEAWCGCECERQENDDVVIANVGSRGL